MKYIFLFLFIYLIYKLFKGLTITATSMNSSSYGSQESTKSSYNKGYSQQFQDNVTKKRKFFSENDGEYVDFEEVE